MPAGMIAILKSGAKCPVWQILVKLGVKINKPPPRLDFGILSGCHTRLGLPDIICWYCIQYHYLHPQGSFLKPRSKKTKKNTCILGFRCNSCVGVTFSFSSFSICVVDGLAKMHLYKIVTRLLDQTMSMLVHKCFAPPFGWFTWLMSICYWTFQLSRQYVPMWKCQHLRLGTKAFGKRIPNSKLSERFDLWIVYVLNGNDTDKLGFTCWKAITHIWHIYLHLDDVLYW